MNINQHMCNVGRNTLENVAKYYLGEKPVNAFISHQYNGRRMGVGRCIPCSQEQLVHTLNITTNLITELRYQVTDGTSVSPARKNLRTCLFLINSQEKFGDQSLSVMLYRNTTVHPVHLPSGTISLLPNSQIC